MSLQAKSQGSGTHVRVARDDGIAELTLCRPKVNAMNTELLAELASAFEQLERDAEVRGILVRAEGNAFSAGLDLVEVASLDDAGLEVFLAIFDDAFGSAFRLDKPMAAAVAGHAIAGGLVLALCADHLALEQGSYKCGLTELAVGVPFPRSAYEIVAAATPPRALRALIYGAATHSPAELFDMGVGDVLVTDANVAAKSWLATQTSRSLVTFAEIKRGQRRTAREAIASETVRERRQLVAATLATKHGAPRVLR